FYMPVPYNMDFELNIMTKINDDMLQIVEQILPYFQPSYTITVNLLDTLGENKDIPIVLNSITMNDDYEGNFQNRRALIYTLRFTAKTFLFGPASSGVSKDIIITASFTIKVW
ncbi:MAG: tail sheath stabilizer and completion protein, partial [Chitinophagaceae bacterium]